MAKPEIQSGKPAPTIKEYAHRLANSHAEAEVGDVEVFLSWEHGEVRLIEVAEHLPSSDEPMPFHFAPQPNLGFYFPVVILLINTSVWNEETKKDSLLPDDWSFKEFLALEELDQ